MKILLLFISIVMVCTSIANAAERIEKYNYKGIGIGTEITTLFGHGDDVKCKQVNESSKTKVCVLIPGEESQHATFIGVKVNWIVLHVYESKIVRLAMVTDSYSDSVEKTIVNALTEKYGKCDKLTKKNSFTDLWGTDRSALHWENGDEHMLYGSLIPAYEIGIVGARKKTDIVEAYGFKPYEPHPKYIGVSVQFYATLLIVSNSQYLNAVNINSEEEKSDFIAKKKKEEDAAVNDL